MAEGLRMHTATTWMPPPVNLLIEGSAAFVGVPLEHGAAKFQATLAGKTLVYKCARGFSKTLW